MEVSKWACNLVLVVHEKRNSAFTIFVLVRGEPRVASPATISHCEHVEGERFFCEQASGQVIVMGLTTWQRGTVAAPLQYPGQGGKGGYIGPAF